MSASTQRYHPQHLNKPEIIIYFICRIESGYPNERIEFVTNFCNRFIDRIDKYTQSQSNNKEENLNDDNSNNDMDIDQYLSEKQQKRYYTDEDIYDTIENAPFHIILCLFSPYIIHHRFMCPIKELSHTFSKLIQYINQKLNLTLPHLSAPYPLSGFLELESIKLPYQITDSNTNINTIDNDNDNNCNNNNNDDNENVSMTNGLSSSSSKSMLKYSHKQLFSMFGRVNNLHLLLETHKEYLNDFLDLFHALMYENNGPLSQEHRQYLGLMASSRYDCKPIIQECELQYQKFNGDMSWIKSGITSAPQKYQKLAKINAILAHQPWAISSTDIADLVNGKDAWSISEITQGFVILIMYHFLCGMYQGLCITPEIDHYYASTVQAMQSQIKQEKKQQKEDEILANVLDNILSPVVTQQPQNSADSIQNGVTTLQLDNNNKLNEEIKSDINDKQSSLPTVLLNDINEEDDEEEDQRSQTIAKLLSHTQQQLIEDEDIVGVKKKGFEQAACLNLDLESVSEANLQDANRSCFITFRQLSDSADDDNDNENSNNHESNDSLSMEFDPNLAPPSLSNNSARNISTCDTETNGLKDKTQIESISMQPIDEEKKFDIYKFSDSLDYVSSIPTKQPNELTSNNWKQLISLRKQNMFPMASITSNEAQKSLNEQNYYDTNEQKLAKITNPQKNNPKFVVQKSNNNVRESSIGNGKKRKYPKIISPKTQGLLYWKYSLGIDMKYKDFDCHDDNTIHLYDFNWDKHGYACLSRYYPGIEKKMDAVFKRAYTMTDFSINNKTNLDTEPFRIAVWHYTFRLYGVNNDSYEYRFVNVYLPVKLKIFIKKLVCYPQTVTIDDFKKMGVALKEREKIHVAILALEAKKKSIFIICIKIHYAIYAILLIYC